MNELSRRILDNLTTAVLLLDVQLRITYLNPAAEMLFALSRRKARQMALKELLPGEIEFESNLREALTGGHPYTARELPLHLPGARSVTVDCTVTPMLEPGYAPALLVEMLHLDRHLRISREEHLISQSQATRALIRGLAHEIKNPLGGLRGAAQLLERELPDESLKEYTQVIIDEADRLRNLVNSMAGPSALPRREPVNLHQVLERVRVLAAAEKPDNITIRTDYDPSIPEVPADVDQLIQALLNLVRNALQALSGSEGEGAGGEIILRSRVLRRYTIGHQLYRLVARVDVIDNGPGIPPELGENIFYPMVTGRADGTGLGLTIAQSMINHHGGLIECHSEPGHTAFTILLPLEPVAENRDVRNPVT